MPDGESIADKAFEWFRSSDVDPVLSSLERATQWLHTPQAKVRATRIMYNVGSPDALLESALSVVTTADLPVWDGPADAEQFLSGLLIGCAYFLGSDPV